MGDGDKTRRELTNFSFMVEIKGVLQAAFLSVTGIGNETEILEYVEGGVTEYTHKIPGQTKQSNIVLKQGQFVGDNSFPDWRKSMTGQSGPPQRHDGSIVLMNPAGEEVKRWNFVRGWPTKWEGPELTGMGNERAIETLEIAHEGIWPA
jgi:phage tail-like protein